MPDGRSAWQPGATLTTLTALAALRRRVRGYFDDAGVLEVQTACLGRHTVTDPSIESFRVDLAGVDHFLQTSPEYYMKRLLAAGAPDIYQLGPVFRAGEAGRRHQPEFTLIEWYRHGFDYDAIIRDTLALIETATGQKRPVHRRRYDGVFRDTLGIDPYEAATDALEATLGADAPVGLDERDAMLDWLFVTAIAPTFDAGAWTVLTHYPASQAALAQLDREDPRAALRFEVFAGSLELGNGFVELSDAREQARRFENDRDRRRRRGAFVPETDTQLLAALAHGLPACAGVAVGLERLAMLAVGVDDIAKVMAFAPVTDTAPEPRE